MNTKSNCLTKKDKRKMKTLVYGYQFVSRVFEKISAENGAKKT